MSVEAWADAARRAPYHDNAYIQRAIDILQSLLEGKTTPDTAAGMVNSLYEPGLKHGGVKPVGAFWGLVCDAVRALGRNEELADRLINLLESISKLPDVRQSGAAVYWRTLPEMGWIFREHAIYVEAEDDFDGVWDDQVEPLLNATTFAAMYLARGKDRVGAWWHAEAHLRGGIEMRCQTPEERREAMMYIPAAATWVILAGEKIYELCKSEFKRQDVAPGYREGWLWGKSLGYSLERWAFWKERFNELAMADWLKDDIKNMVVRAASEMEKVEDQLQ